MSTSGKLMNADEAVRKFVKTGSSICFSGFTVNRNPTALTHSIVRQKIGKLHVVMHSGGQSLDLLIGAGLVDVLEIAYGANGRFASTCVRFKKAAEEGTLRIEDYSNYLMTLRFMAGAMGVPFLPTFSGLGSDIVERWGIDRKTRATHPSLPKMKLAVSDDPFSDPARPIVCVPAVNPDVCLLHVQQASEDGTARIQGLTFADAEQARASKAVIVSCEELVPSDELRKEPWLNSIPGLIVNAVVHQPYGAHPTACHLHYDYDSEHLAEYSRMASSDEGFQEYLSKYVTGVSSYRDYIALLGATRLREIKASPELGYHRREHR